MNLHIFEKSPAIAPLLVRLYESQKLYSLAQDGRPLAQVELTGAVADLLDIPLNAHEQELLTDVLIALMRHAEKDLRQALAEKLSGMPTVPLRIILHLANDEITVAAPVLRKSPVLSDLDLIYIIKSQGSDYWQAIATRENLSAQVVDSLAATGDTATVVILSENERIRLTEYAVGILARAARSNDNIARPLLRRPEVPYSIARELYIHVGEELKTFIRSFYGISEETQEVDKAIDEVIVDFVDSVAVSEFMPNEQMIKAAQKYGEMGMLSTQAMIETLQKGLIPNFIAMFAQYSSLPVRRIHDFLKQPHPKGMAIACRAFGVQKSDFSRIYLMTHRMRSKDRVVNHKDMLDILAYFDKVRPEAAIKVVRGGALQ